MLFDGKKVQMERNWSGKEKTEMGWDGCKVKEPIPKTHLK